MLSGNMEEIKPLLEAIQYQTNSLVVLSTGAMGFIVYTWLRIANVFGDSPTIAPFQRQWILAIPLLGFAICITSGHKSNTYVTGFLFEIFQKQDAFTKRAITDPGQYFADNYLPIFEQLAAIQMLFYFASMAIFMLWFAVNIWRRKRA